MGHCLCLRSVCFYVTPGATTDLGRVRRPFVEARQRPEREGPCPKTEFGLPAGTTSFALALPVTGAAIDSRIGAFPIKPATYRAQGKLPNWMGLSIDRISTIPGVIAYDRDRIVDPQENASH